jgi:hypothetical protein
VSPAGACGIVQVVVVAMFPLLSAFSEHEMNE